MNWKEEHNTWYLGLNEAPGTSAMGDNYMARVRYNPHKDFQCWVANIHRFKLLDGTPLSVLLKEVGTNYCWCSASAKNWASKALTSLQVHSLRVHPDGQVTDFRGDPCSLDGCSFSLNDAFRLKTIESPINGRRLTTALRHDLPIIVEVL